MYVKILNRVQENGKMECIVCDLKLKDMDHWEKHMKSLVHKENLKNYAAKDKDKKPPAEKTPEEKAPEEKTSEEKDEFEVPAPRKPVMKVDKEEVEEEIVVNETDDKDEKTQIVNDFVLPQVFT